MAFISRKFDSNAWYLRARRMAGAAYHAWVANDPQAINEFKDLKNKENNYEVLAYFGDDLSRVYQIEQWLPVFEELNKTHKIQIITRQFPTTKYLRKLTNLPVNSVYDFFTLTDLIDNNNFKVVLYVNNSFTNFQAMAAKKAFHVHLNHGESDKMSMTSRQMYAYDVVAVAGQAAKDRLAKALIVKDENKEVVIGRPQLDFLGKAMDVPLGRKVLVYAPTWFGDQDANNYSSLDVYGEQIIEAMLKVENATVIYKPHPKIASSPKSVALKTHKVILEKLERANSKNSLAKHAFVIGDPMPVLQVADLLVSDVSAVTIDYLYLKPTGAMLMCDRRSDEKLFAEVAPISKAVTVITKNNIGSIDKLINDYVLGNFDRSKYDEQRNYYFGDTKPGSSVARFNAMIDDLIKRRDTRVAQMPTTN
jgi:CDP-glycerol glycerophosphotransferase (TagB/SpsB family)